MISRDTIQRHIKRKISSIVQEHANDQEDSNEDIKSCSKKLKYNSISKCHARIEELETMITFLKRDLQQYKDMYIQSSTKLEESERELNKKNQKNKDLEHELEYMELQPGYFEGEQVRICSNCKQLKYWCFCSKDQLRS